MANIMELLDVSGLSSAPEAAQAIRAGWVVGKPLDIDDSSGLREVYRNRLEHLRKKAGNHTSQLASSLAELVEGLPGASDVQIVTVTGPAEHDFQIFLADGATRVVCCLRTISVTNVSPDRWTELWRNAN